MTLNQRNNHYPERMARQFLPIFWLAVIISLKTHITDKTIAGKPIATWVIYNIENGEEMVSL